MQVPRRRVGLTQNGTAYVTYYEPIKAADGSVIGAFAVGNDVSLQDFLLEKQIADVHLFDAGGMYLLEVDGNPENAVFLAPADKKGQKLTAVFPDAKPFLSQLAQAPDGYVRHVISVLGDAGSDAWAVMRNTSDGNIWLVAQIPERASMAKYWSNMLLVWGLLLGASVLIGDISQAAPIRQRHRWTK